MGLEPPRVSGSLIPAPAPPAVCWAGAAVLVSPGREGAVMVLIDVDTERGGLTVNKDFLVDFGKEPCGPCLAKDIHFPCGDATTEVFN